MAFITAADFPQLYAVVFGEGVLTLGLAFLKGSVDFPN